MYNSRMKTRNITTISEPSEVASYNLDKVCLRNPSPEFTTNRYVASFDWNDTAEAALSVSTVWLENKDKK